MAHKGNTDNLKIGDTVLLFYSADKRFAADSADKSGYILADLSGSGSRQLLTVQPSDRQLQSIQSSTFKVLTSNKYEAQTRYRALVEKIKELKRKKMSQSAMQLLQLQATQAKRDSEVEVAENAANQKRLKGTSINYGDCIQLLHTLTGKYICVSSSETSITEKSKLKVYLQKKDSVGCIFRLHPHIKVQTVGEEVNYDDQIKFESVSTEGQFLHCSKRTFGEVNVNINSHSFELNAAAKESPLKIICHYQATDQGLLQSDKALRASGIVRFFHRKHLCYIVGEGSFAGRYASLPDIPDDTNAISGAASTSSLFESTLRRKLKRPPTPEKPHKMQITVDIEPNYENVSSLRPSNLPPVERQPMAISGDGSKAATAKGTKISRGAEKEIKYRICDDDVVSEDVHFRSRQTPGGMAAPPSTSPDTFWQIEKSHDPCSGEPMAWSEKCRIKHLPTRRYLAVTGDATDYKVTLSHKLDASSTLTIFELFPVVQQIGEKIGEESYVRVKHVDTGTWLHLNKDVRYTPKAGEEFDGEQNLEEEDGKELYQVIATKDINSDDAFALQKVREKLVADFNYVAGVTAVLTNQLQQCEMLGGDQPHSTGMCHMGPALSSLNYLKYLLLKDREKDTMKSKQKFLKGMKTLELVIRLLNLHKDEKSNDQEVCTACFGIIIAFLEGNSSKNKTHISQMISHIFTPSVWETELSDGQTVEKALIGIAKDNPSLLYDMNFIKQVSWHLVQKFLVADKNSNRAIQLLEGLSVLCSCNEVPIKQNQSIILKELQAAYDDGQHQPNRMLYPVRVQPFSKSQSEEDPEVGAQVKFAGQVSLEMEELGSKPRRKRTKKSKNREEEETIKDVVQFQAVERSGSWHELSSGSGIFFDFFLAQLRLLVQMCRGNNEAVIDVLRGTPGTKTFGVEITFPVITRLIDDTYIKRFCSNLRATLLSLLRVMYVEVGENRPFLEKLPFSFKVEEVSRVPFASTTKDVDRNKAEITALTGIENEHSPAIRLWIKNFFQDETQYIFAADEDDKNGVVVQVLQLLAVLVKYGYYDNAKDVKDLLPSLYKLLDGKNDFPTKKIKQIIEITEDESQSTRFRSRSSTRITQRSFRASLHRASVRRASVSRASIASNRRHLPRHLQVDQDDIPDLEDIDPDYVLKTLSEFREKGGRYIYLEERHNHFEIKHWAMEVLNLLLNFKLYKNLHNFIYDFRWLSQSCGSKSLKAPKGIQDELGKLLHTYPREAKLLKDEPRQAKMLFNVAADRMKYLNRNRNDPDLTNDNKLPNMLLDLANYAYDDLIQHSLLLLDRHYTLVSDVFQKALQTSLLKMDVSTQLHNDVAKIFLRLTDFLRAGSSFVEGDEQSPVKILTNFCWLEGEVEGCEPHQINQNIILSFGILSDVLKYIMQHSTGTSAEHESKKITECLLFLRALACQNPTVQKRLLEYVDLFLKLAHGEIRPCIGLLLSEIFSGGPSISLAVTEKQISKIMHLIFARGQEDSCRTNASFFHALQELLKVKEVNLPLRHNQLNVARCFNLMREDDRYWCKDLTSDGKRDLRWDILTAEDDSNFQLVNLLMITDLLATCAFGEKSGANSICCTIFSEEELISIISNKDIKLYRKRPFLKFLAHVYMNVDEEAFEERAKLYRSNKDLWGHMSEMAAVLHGTSEVMKDMPHPSYLSVKELIVDPSWKYLHECPNRKHLQSPSPVILRGQKFDISDVLLYVSEAFLPFLQVFYSGVYKKTHHREQRVLEGGATEELYKSLLELYTPLISERVYFPSEVQVKLYFRVVFVMKLHSSSQLSIELFNVEDHMEKHPEIFYRELVSEARENYNTKYAEEIELNEKFKQFVTNYKAAYEGKNTRRAQVTDVRNKWSVSDKKPYSEFHDEDANKPGLRYLPLGPSFQKHVSIFKMHKSGALGRLGDTLDIAARLGSADSEKEDEVVRNPKERLLKQLEISLSKKRHGDTSISKIDSERQTELDIKCLQILRASIYNEIIQINEEDRERSPQKFRKECELHLHPIQNEIQDLGNAVLRIMPLLSHPNETIMYEALAFLEVLFEFRNPHVQEGSKELIKLNENQIFQILQSGLRSTTVIYKESQLLTTLLEARTTFDKRILSQTVEVEGEEEKDVSRSNFGHRSSSLPMDGKLTLTAPRRSIFRRRQTTQVLIAGGDTRVPFLAIYQHSDANASLGEKDLSIVEFSDLSRITMIIKVLGLSCDGQNREMQNFLREQSTSIQNINMVGEITSVLYEFTEKRQICYETLPLYIQLLQSLVNMCLGNHENHNIVFNKHIGSVINFILQIDISDIKPPKRFGRRADTSVITNLSTNVENLCDDVQEGEKAKLDYVDLRVMGLKLKASAIELLEVMMEEISKKSKKLTQQIAEGLNIQGLHSSMVDLFVLKSDKDVIRLEYNDNASRALYKAYKILMHLVDSGSDTLENLKPTDKGALRAWEFCEKKSRSIEIVYKDEKSEEKVLTKVHFDANINTKINERLVNSVKYKVDRSTYSDRLRDFHEWIEAVKKDTLHHDWLKRKHFSAITSLSKLRYWFLLLLTLALNIVVIIAYKAPKPNTLIPTKPELRVNNSLINPILFYVLGGLHTLFSLWMVLEYFIVTWPHFVLPKFLYKIKVRLLPNFHRTHSSVNIFGATTLYVIIFLASSAVSLALIHINYVGYFYCFCLLYIIVNNDILQRALQSVTKNWKSLFWVALLLLAILFIYAVIAFAFYQVQFHATENIFCESLDQCFVSVLRHGLLEGFLNVGFRSNITSEQATEASGRLFFDVTFFIIVTTVGLNIVFGIIIDTFSELRDARFHAEQEMKSSCFICSIPNHIFDKLSYLGFAKHVKNDHNMWDYIYYSIYLDRVDTADHTATEKYIYEKMKSGNPDYLPLNQALVLEEKEEEDEELKKEVQVLQDAVKQRFTTMNLHIDARLDAIEKLLNVRNGQ